MRTDLALRLFENDNGRLPANLDELCPNYLPKPLWDAFTGRPLIYRCTGDQFTLYSVGDDGVDNGGRFTNWGTQFGDPGYDLDLDTLTRP